MWRSSVLFPGYWEGWQGSLLRSNMYGRRCYVAQEWFTILVSWPWMKWRDSEEHSRCPNQNVCHVNRNLHVSLSPLISLISKSSQKVRVAWCYFAKTKLLYSLGSIRIRASTDREHDPIGTIHTNLFGNKSSSADNNNFEHVLQMRNIANSISLAHVCTPLPPPLNISLMLSPSNTYTAQLYNWSETLSSAIYP